MLGSTIADLQERLTQKEILIWWAYRDKYGPHNPVRMYDQGAAFIATQVNRMRGGKATTDDFLPYPRKSEVEAVAIETPEEFVAALGGNIKIGR